MPHGAGAALRHGIAFLAATALFTCSVAQAWDWVPTDEEIKKYRQGWNPFSNGPMFISGVDIHPKGQFTAHPFIFSQIQYRISDQWVGAAGCLFAVAGQNTQDAIFPNFSIYYYLEQERKSDHAVGLGWLGAVALRNGQHRLGHDLPDPDHRHPEDDPPDTE